MNISRRRQRSVPLGFRQALTLIELLVCLAILAVLVAFLLPVTRSREASRRSQCRNNLKQIGLALHNYHDTYGSFPPAYTVDSYGNRLHSWRTLILPYMDQGPLYNQLDLSKPWDDPANAEVFKGPVSCYSCPSSAAAADHTSYLAILAPNGCFRGSRSTTITEIHDGTSQTLLVIEVDAAHAVPWMSPNDADRDLFLSLGASSKLSHPPAMSGLMADGAIHTLPPDMPAAERVAMMTIAENDGPQP